MLFSRAASPRKGIVFSVDFRVSLPRSPKCKDQSLPPPPKNINFICFDPSHRRVLFSARVWPRKPDLSSLFSSKQQLRLLSYGRVMFTRSTSEKHKRKPLLLFCKPNYFWKGSAFTREPLQPRRRRHAFASMETSPASAGSARGPGVKAGSWAGSFLGPGATL